MSQSISVLRRGVGILGSCQPVEQKGMQLKITALCKIQNQVDFAAGCLWNVKIRDTWKYCRGLIIGAN